MEPEIKASDFALFAIFLNLNFGHVSDPQTVLVSVKKTIGKSDLKPVPILILPRWENPESSSWTNVHTSNIVIVAFLENATIGYSLESLCVCVCVSVCVFAR